jgi:hypothetical protein
MKLVHRTAVAELVAALVKGNRTMRELCEWTDLTNETVNSWVREFMAAGLVYIADYRKNRTGPDSPVYGWVCSDEVDVEAPGLATNPTAVRVRTAYRQRRQRERSAAAPTPIPAEISAWKPRMNGSPDWDFHCTLCSRQSRQLGSGWVFTGLERVHVCAACKPAALARFAEVAA